MEIAGYQINQEGPIFVQILGPCWVISKKPTQNGYQNVSIGNGKRALAHRVMFERIKGPIQKGLEIDHLCRNTACMNPNHLEAVTHRENMLRSPIAGCTINKFKTHCPKGHSYSDNLYINSKGRRECSICRRFSTREFHRRKVKKSGRELKQDNKLKTNCPSGHSYSGDNLLIDIRGGRNCRICSDKRKKKHYEFMKERKCQLKLNRI
jgi:hypothetical protein